MLKVIGIISFLFLLFLYGTAYAGLAVNPVTGKLDMIGASSDVLDSILLIGSDTPGVRTLTLGGSEFVVVTFNDEVVWL